MKKIIVCVITSLFFTVSCKCQAFQKQSDSTIIVVLKNETGAVNKLLNRCYGLKISDVEIINYYKTTDAKDALKYTVALRINFATDQIESIQKLITDIHTYGETDIANFIY